MTNQEKKVGRLSSVKYGRWERRFSIYCYWCSCCSLRGRSVLSHSPPSVFFWFQLRSSQITTFNHILANILLSCSHFPEKERRIAAIAHHLWPILFFLQMAYSFWKLFVSEIRKIKPIHNRHFSTHLNAAATQSCLAPFDMESSRSSKWVTSSNGEHEVTQKGRHTQLQQ